MPQFLRRLVSGSKARHRDETLNLELDLVYLTSRIILMGLPSTGVQALYRNPIRQVRQFLDTKHPEHYRVYALCPRNEGSSYDPQHFHARVSRYVWPDHHAPPLSLMALFVADALAYLAEDSLNTIVIHCKAGKGRTGTMACALLLSMPSLMPESAVAVSRSHSALQQTSSDSVVSSTTSLPAKGRDTTPAARLRGAASFEAGHTLSSTLRAPAARSTSYLVSDSRPSSEVHADVSERLRQVFEYHTSKRMRPKTPRTHIETKSLRRTRSARETFQMVFPKSRSIRASTSAGTAATDCTTVESSMERASDHEVLPRKPSLASIPGGQSTDEVDSMGMRRFHGAVPLAGTDLPSASPVGIAHDWLKTDPAPQLEEARRHRSRSRSRSRSPELQRVTAVKGSTSTSAAERKLVSKSSSLERLKGVLRPNRPKGDERIVANTGADVSKMLPPTMGVSIPSQRRFVGYYARCLAGRDARLAFSAGFGTAIPISSASSLSTTETGALRHDLDRGRRSSHSSITAAPSVKASTSAPPSSGPVSEPLRPALCSTPRRIIRITSIVIERTPLPNVAPIRDALSLQLGRYNNALVSRLEKWECKARRRALAFGAHDPGGTAFDRRTDGITSQMESDDRWKVPFNPAIEVDHARNFEWQDIDAKPQSENGMFELIGRLPRSSVVAETLTTGDKVERHVFDLASYGSSTRDFSFTPPKAASSGLPLLDITPPTPRSAKDYAGNISAIPSLPDADASAAKPALDLAEPSLASGGGLLIDPDRELQIKVLVGRTGATHGRLPDALAACWTWFIAAFEEPRSLPDPAQANDAGDEQADGDSCPREEIEQVSDEGYVSTGRAGDEQLKHSNRGSARKETVQVGSATILRLEAEELDFKKPLGIKAMEIRWEWVKVM